MQYYITNFNNGIITIKINRTNEQLYSCVGSICKSLLYLYDLLEKNSISLNFKIDGIQSKFNEEKMSEYSKQLLENGETLKEVDFSKLTIEEVKLWIHHIELLKFKHASMMTSKYTKVIPQFQHFERDNIKLNLTMANNSSNTTIITYYFRGKNTIDRILEDDIKTKGEQRHIVLAYNLRIKQGIRFDMYLKNEKQNSKAPMFTIANPGLFNSIVNEIKKNRLFYAEDNSELVSYQLAAPNIPSGNFNRIAIRTSPLLNDVTIVTKEEIEPPTKKVKLLE